LARDPAELEPGAGFDVGAPKEREGEKLGSRNGLGDGIGVGSSVGRATGNPLQKKLEAPWSDPRHSGSEALGLKLILTTM
jgi:hypothetical protein